MEHGQINDQKLGNKFTLSKFTSYMYVHVHVCFIISLLGYEYCFELWWVETSQRSVWRRGQIMGYAYSELHISHKIQSINIRTKVINNR